jgi:ABC-type uncharacterized transport system permease subunit
MDFGRLDLRRGATGYLVPVAAVLGALAVCAIFLLIAGQNPLRAAAVLVEGALGSMDNIYEVLTRTVPLMIVGLGITVAFRANIYNIGADGQVIVGAVVGVVALQATGDLGAASVPWLLAACVAGGAAYGGLAGWLRARFDANEIIVTIMMNYVAVQLLGWLVRGPLQGTPACSRARTISWRRRRCRSWCRETCIRASSSPWRWRCCCTWCFGAACSATRSTRSARTATRPSMAASTPRASSCCRWP